MNRVNKLGSFLYLNTMTENKCVYTIITGRKISKQLKRTFRHMDSVKVMKNNNKKVAEKLASKLKKFRSENSDLTVHVNNYYFFDHREDVYETLLIFKDVVARNPFQQKRIDKHFKTLYIDSMKKMAPVQLTEVYGPPVISIQWISIFNIGNF